jgi:hypothetical protein
MDSRLKNFNDYLIGRFIGSVDYATFRSGNEGIELRGFYDIIGSNPLLVEKYKYNSFSSYRIPHRFTNGEHVEVHSSFSKIDCYGFKIPIGKIIISPKDKIYIESKNGEVVSIEYIDHVEEHHTNGFSLDYIMEKFEVIKF